jgi:hypothetical protein
MIRHEGAGIKQSPSVAKAGRGLKIFNKNNIYSNKKYYRTIYNKNKSIL